MLRVIAVFIGAVVFMLTLFQSVTIAVDWWQGRIATLSGWQTVWLLLLPVMTVVYLRGFFVLRPGCATCATPESSQAERARHEAGR